MTTVDWIKIALVVLGYIVTFTVMWTKLGGRVDSLEKDAQIRRGQHREHYEATKQIETVLAGMDQKLTSHITDDQRQIDSITELLREQREDTKDILKHLRNGGK